MNDISNIASKDAPTVTNEKGGSQSHIPTRFDLVDGKSMFAMAGVLHEGAEKYGANNWRNIDVEDHLNHLIMHAYAYLSGDRSDEHLSHIMCRAMFAQAVEITEEEQTPSDYFNKDILSDDKMRDKFDPEFERLLDEEEAIQKDISEAKAFYCEGCGAGYHDIPEEGICMLGHESKHMTSPNHRRIRRNIDGRPTT